MTDLPSLEIDDEQFEQCPECAAYSLWPDGWCANCEKYIFEDDGSEEDENYDFFDNFEGEP